MDSRLDRLFVLLDTGSNESIRFAAAKQLGEVQRVQPNDLEYLLHRIKEYSSKSVWETRVAAGQAIRCVLEQVGPWPDQDSTKNDAENNVDEKFQCRLSIAESLIQQNSKSHEILDQFDLEKIMSTGPKLLSIDITENDEQTGNSSSSKGNSKGGRRGARKESLSGKLLSKNDKDQLLRQRKLINKELGIAMVDSLNLGVKSTDIVSNDDLRADYEIEYESTNKTATHPATLISSNYDKIINLLSKENCISLQQPNDTSKEKTINNRIQCSSYSINQWQLFEITEQYSKDLFNLSWEVRHGAAVALREIVRLQGKFAGRMSNLTKDTNDKLNQLWLIDMALKSLSVLALDKFGDFLFDQVVAPVRENAAQLLGCCIANMSEANARSTIKIVLRMLDNPDWETRHGGVLALKYSLNIGNETFSKMILQESFDLIFKCLADPVDDVSAEAAAALVPVKDLMIETVPDNTPKLIKFLWDHLSDLDELTTSTSNIVLLLASLITSSSTQLETTELIKSIPRLWSLLNHSSSSVRMSALKAIKTLLEAQKSTCLDWMSKDLITLALRLVFQRSILETMDDVRTHIEDVWMQLIRISPEPESSFKERFNLLKSTSKYLNYWLCLVMHPSNAPIDRGAALWLNIGSDGSTSATKPEGEIYIGSHSFNAENSNQQKSQITKCRLIGTRLLGALYANLVNDFSNTEEAKHFKETLKYLSDMFAYYIKTNSANQRIFSGWILESWASEQNLLTSDNHEILKKVLPTNLAQQIDMAIQECSIWYDELASIYTRLQHETRDFVGALKEANIINPNLASEHQIDILVADKRTIYKLSQIEALCGLELDKELERADAKKTQASSKKSTLEDDIKNCLVTKKSNLIKSLRSTKTSHRILSTSVLSSLACAQISWRLLPALTDARLKLIIRPLIDSIEVEEEQSLQDKSIKYLIFLIEIICSTDAEHRPLIDHEVLNRLIAVISIKALSVIFEPDECILNSVNILKWSPPEKSRRIFIDANKIVLLDDLQRKAELSRATSRRQSSVNTVPSLKRSHSLTSPLDTDNSSMQDELERPNFAVSETKLRGASVTLKMLAEHFGEDLPTKLPKLWQALAEDIKRESELYRKDISEKVSEEGNEIKLVKSLRLLEVIGESLHVNLRKHLLDLYANLILLLATPSSIIRHLSAQCIGVISKLMFAHTIRSIQKNIIPMLDVSDSVISRCGAIEAIAFIIEHLQLDLVPHINIFIVHVLKRMSDQNDQVRLMATHCFGKLLSLMPLNLDKNKVNLNANQETKPADMTDLDGDDMKQDEKTFIEQLLNPKKLDNFKLPFAMQTELRSYQQDGLNWLAFLNRFNLHGILCDEMGLGKTLMTICMVASDHVFSKPIINLKKSDDDKKDQSTRPSKCPPSLIVCPSTLTEHWLYEIDKFLPVDIKKALNPVAYSGVLNDRMYLRCQILQTINGFSRENDLYQKQFKPINLVVASYDIVRNDIDFFREIHWNYCVLDEGHIIKNGKTKLSRAIRLLNAKHRLILSGTPIQNNVTELWSLFDYLMPGFLGSERQFNSRYSKPILQSREVKCSTRDLEAGALAMESLHRQVLPFILRRLKEDVLDDLPPKIIQDYFCELSSLQHKLYEDFTRSKLCKNVTKQSISKLADNNDECDNVNESTSQELSAKANSKSHVFQALQYLKNVCNHPKLVLTDKHSQYLEIKKSLDSEKSSLDDIAHSSKLNALKQLLIDCGIGAASPTNEEPTAQQQQTLTIQSVVNQHRALIFCQIRSMVDIIENDLLKRHFSTITYLKLDGSIPANQRHSIVSRFNNDPSIDILLLTTQIGGLGLNLTGADTVIFVEHDWNPTKDLQAMDRAHRIGQKKVVNVYRLITKGTLEEKIMGLQKFKTIVSNTVINQDNTGLGTMNVDQLFDLFEDTTAGASLSDDKERARGIGGKSSKSFMDLLPELWDQQQYETEYDLGNFVSSLKN